MTFREATLQAALESGHPREKAVMALAMASLGGEPTELDEIIPPDQERAVIEYIKNRFAELSKDGEK
jgi:hypothetical protein